MAYVREFTAPIVSVLASALPVCFLFCDSSTSITCAASPEEIAVSLLAELSGIGAIEPKPHLKEA